MTKTRDELVLRALANLGVLPAGQTESEEEFEQVEALVLPVMESLSARNIYYVADATAIPRGIYRAGALTSSESVYALARAYKVSQTAIRFVRERETWRHVQP